MLSQNGVGSTENDCCEIFVTKSKLKASLAVWRNLLPDIFQGGLQPGSPSRRAAPAQTETTQTEMTTDPNDPDRNGSDRIGQINSARPKIAYPYIVSNHITPIAWSNRSEFSFEKPENTVDVSKC